MREIAQPSLMLLRPAGRASVLRYAIRRTVASRADGAGDLAAAGARSTAVQGSGS
ncbi:MAG: hypothetical protein R6W93_06515 [Candidatus Limnocylindrales bacterium]